MWKLALVGVSYVDPKTKEKIKRNSIKFAFICVQRISHPSSSSSSSSSSASFRRVELAVVTQRPSEGHQIDSVDLCCVRDYIAIERERQTLQALEKEVNTVNTVKQYRWILHHFRLCSCVVCLFFGQN